MIRAGNISIWNISLSRHAKQYLSKWLIIFEASLKIREFRNKYCDFLLMPKAPFSLTSFQIPPVDKEQVYISVGEKVIGKVM